ncbi:MAG: hydroxyacylglutathione hydrolase, partial [Myxococcota bacterium]
MRPLPCLLDNYAYLLVRNGHAVVVDPSEAEPVLEALDGLVLDAIWCTHHDGDHVGGVPGILARHDVPVVGSRYDLDRRRIPGQTTAVGDGNVVTWGDLRAKVYEIPGHTLGAVAFEVDGHLFTGDTLFSGGCGRVFEGTLPQMRASLATLKGLDPALRVWCGHEYTVKNLEFAEQIAPEAAVTARLSDARARRERGEPTVGDP